MAELRRDDVEGRWVAVAPERSHRPGFKLEAPRYVAPPIEAECPFCEGREERTPPEIIAYGREGSTPDKPGWLVRVVPNLYGAFKPECSLENDPHSCAMAARGSHEVIILGPEHHTELTGLAPGILTLGLQAIGERMKKLFREEGASYVQAFFNIGREAGATLSHAHGQIIALPVVPQPMEAEVRRFAESEACPLCREIEQARSMHTMIFEQEGLLAYCPPASAAPYEWCIVPRGHEGRFEERGAGEMDSLARAMIFALTAQGSLLESPPYNMYLHTAPNGTADDAFHWHLRCRPRLTIDAGFEMATGMGINPMDPAESAVGLRRHLSGDRG